MYTTVGTFEAKTHLSDLLDQVERGDKIVITKHGRPVARLMPVGNVNRELVHETIRRIKEFGVQNKLNGINWTELRDEGRK